MGSSPDRANLGGGSARPVAPYPPVSRPEGAKRLRVQRGRAPQTRMVEERRSF